MKKGYNRLQDEEQASLLAKVTNAAVSSTEEEEKVVVEEYSHLIDIDVDLEENCVSKGDKLRGKITLTPRANLKVKEITLHIQGIEEVSIITSKQTFKETDNVLQDALEVTGEGQLQNDQKYVYSFEYDIPDDPNVHLPGTFVEETLHYGETVKVDVRYYATLEIDFVNEYQQSTANKTSTIHYHKEFIMNNDNSTLKPGKRASAAKFQNVENYTSDRPGRISLSAALESEVVSVGSKVVLRTDVRNDSDIAISTITITIHRIMTLNAQGKSVVMQDEVYRKGIAGVPPMTQNVRNTAIIIPAELQSCTTGKYVSAEYRLRVACSMVSKEDLDVVFPIAIVVSDQKIPILKRMSTLRLKSRSSIIGGELNSSLMDNDTFADENLNKSSTLEPVSSSACPSCAIL